MASLNEKSDVAVTVTPAPRLVTSAETLTPSHRPSADISYHRPSSVSTPATAQNESLNPFDTDLEAMVSSRTLTGGDDSCGMKSTSNSNLKCSGDGQVWPGQGHWKKKAKTARVNRHSCQMLAKMSKRNRIIAKIGIIALILAIALAVGLGVSKATGARIWSPKDNN